MTDKQINQRIAEACGWKGNLLCRDYEGNLWPSEPPNCCSDLNAMHEAEEMLMKGFEDNPENSELWSDYQTNLIIACPAYLSYHATARQRAEAFLRTLGMWEEVQA